MTFIDQATLLMLLVLFSIPFCASALGVMFGFQLVKLYLKLKERKNKK